MASNQVRPVPARSRLRTIRRQRTGWRRALPSALVVVLAIAGAGAIAGGAVAQSADQWPSFQGGAGHLGQSAGPAVAPPLRVAWKAKTSTGGGEAPSGAVVASGVGVAVGETRVVAVDPRTGRNLWTVPRARGFPVPAALDPSAGTHGVVVYVEGDQTKTGLVGLDLETHARLWRVALRRRVLSAPTIVGGHVFVGGQDQFVYSLDVVSGGVDWKYRTVGVVDTSPAVAAGKVLVVSESLTAGVRLYALDQASGKPVWSFSRPPSSDRTSSVTTDGHAVFVGFSDRTVQALDLRNGLVLWSRPVPTAFTPATAPALSGGSVFVGDADGGLYRFDARTGDRIWDFQLPVSTTGTRSAPLVSGGVVYLGSSDGTLGAIEVSTGKLVWKTRLGAGPMGLLAPDGDLLLASILGVRGGVVALRHDSSGQLVREDSPNDLNVPIALLDYAAAFALVLAGILLVFGYLPRRVGGRFARPGADDSDDPPGFDDGVGDENAWDPDVGP